MKKNYHTHTKRCYHATGEDEEYVLYAIKAGFKLLGFSDHAPSYFPCGHVSHFKMLPEHASEYARSVTLLKKKYENQIDLHLGFEAEYYPEIFEESISFWRSLGTEYLILGQHYVPSEWLPTRVSSTVPHFEEGLKAYTDVCCTAMKTGKFSYIAHPDILNYNGTDNAFYESEARRLIECAIETDTPMEINLHGMRSGRHYPSERFWKIASDYSPSVLFGVDAHAPETFLDFKQYRDGELFAEKFNLKIIENLKFKPI